MLPEYQISSQEVTNSTQIYNTIVYRTLEEDSFGTRITKIISKYKTERTNSDLIRRTHMYSPTYFRGTGLYFNLAVLLLNNDSLYQYSTNQRTMYQLPYLPIC